jgi:hypothetical protein
MAPRSRKLIPCKVERKGLLKPEMTVETVLKTLNIKFGKFKNLLDLKINNSIKTAFYYDYNNTMYIGDKAWRKHCDKNDAVIYF